MSIFEYIVIGFIIWLIFESFRDGIRFKKIDKRLKELEKEICRMRRFR